MIVATRLGLSAGRYCRRYTLPDFRLHAGAFAKEAMAPMAPLYMALEGLAGGLGGKKGPGPVARQAGLPGAAKGIRDIYPWYKTKKGRDYAVVDLKTEAEAKALVWQHSRLRPNKPTLAWGDPRGASTNG